MPNIICPSCGNMIHIEDDDFEGELSCPGCGALLEVVVSGEIVDHVRLLGEGFEGEEFLQDLETWSEKEEERQKS